MNRSKTSIVKTSSAILPTKYGTFKIIVFKSLEDSLEHTVLVSGDKLKMPVLVRIHSACLTGDTFLSLRCDCGEQLRQSMRLIGTKGGIVLYLNQEGRGLGLANKITAYSLQDQGLDTVEANQTLHLPIDSRDYKIAGQILKDLGVFKVRLLTNNPDKLKQLAECGIKDVERISLEVKPHNINRKYLLAKKKKLGHKLELV